MPRGVKKENLPSKGCVVCNRPFTWRKKWERSWDEVQTCSNACKGERKRNSKQQDGTASAAADNVDGTQMSAVKDNGAQLQMSGGGGKFLFREEDGFSGVRPFWWPPQTWRGQDHRNWNFLAFSEWSHRSVDDQSRDGMLVCNGNSVSQVCLYTAEWLDSFRVICVGVVCH